MGNCMTIAATRKRSKRIKKYSPWNEDYFFLSETDLSNSYPCMSKRSGRTQSPTFSSSFHYFNGASNNNAFMNVYSPDLPGAQNGSANAYYRVVPPETAGSRHYNGWSKDERYHLNVSSVSLSSMKSLASGVHTDSRIEIEIVEETFGEEKADVSIIEDEEMKEFLAAERLCASTPRENADMFSFKPQEQSFSDPQPSYSVTGSSCITDPSNGLERRAAKYCSRIPQLTKSKRVIPRSTVPAFSAAPHHEETTAIQPSGIPPLNAPPPNSCTKGYQEARESHEPAPQCTFQYTFYVEENERCMKPILDNRIKSIANSYKCHIFSMTVPFNSAKPFYFKGNRVRPITVSAPNQRALLRCLGHIDNQYPYLNAKAFLAVT